MNKDKKLGFIGGDLITVHIINSFLEEGYTVRTYAFDSAYDLIQASDREKAKIFTDDVKDVINFANTIIFAMPFNNETEQIMSTFSNKQISLKELIPELKGKTIFAGRLSTDTLVELREQKTNVHNLNINNEIRVSNALITAESAVRIVSSELDRTIHGTKFLVLGFGRLGKMLCKIFSALNADVTCEARKESDLAWINAYGYKSMHLNDLTDNIHKFDVIINTVPFKILDKERLEKVKPNVFILDLADDERGVDLETARKRNIKNMWALSLPAKNAPLSYAEAIKNTIQTILNNEANKS